MYYWTHRWCLTSSSGSSLRRAREPESSPTMKGVGVQTMSIMDGGRTGMYVCCQVNGYSRATTAWQHLERVLERKRHISVTVLTYRHQQMAAEKNQEFVQYPVNDNTRNNTGDFVSRTIMSFALWHLIEHKLDFSLQICITILQKRGKDNILIQLIIITIIIILLLSND